jgi:hypothetical protein
MISDLDGVEASLEWANGSYPRSPVAATALAMRYTTLGWTARTHSAANQVSSEQFSMFSRWLERSERMLVEVCAEHPRFAPAWAARITNARGLELGMSEARRRYTHLARLTEHSYPAQVQMLQFLLPKWFGTVEAATEFAQDAARAAPPGSDSGALIALLHIERWAQLGQRDGQAHLASPAVHAELVEAASRSVLHPEHRPGPVGVQTHGTFAMAFWLGGHPADAARHLGLIGRRASEFPWRYALDSAAQLEGVRNDVFGPAQRARA